MRLFALPVSSEKLRGPKDEPEKVTKRPKILPGRRLGGPVAASWVGRFGGGFKKSFGYLTPWVGVGGLQLFVIRVRPMDMKGGAFDFCLTPTY